MRLILSAVLLVVLGAPAAQAQGSTATLRFGDGPEGTVEAAQSIQAVPIQLTLQLANVVCAMAGSFRVTLEGTVSATGTNATTNETTRVVAVTPAVTFNVPAGAYGAPGAPAGPAHSGTQSAAFNVLADGLQNVTIVDVHLSATLPAYSGQACRPASPTGSIPGAQGAYDFQIQFNATEAVVTKAPPQVPVPAHLVLVAVAIALTAWSRRVRP